MTHGRVFDALQFASEMKSRDDITELKFLWLCFRSHKPSAKIMSSSSPVSSSEREVKMNPSNRGRTSDLGMACLRNHYSPTLFQLSYRRLVKMDVKVLYEVGGREGYITLYII